MTNQFLMTGTWYSAPFVQDEAKALATFPFDVTFGGDAASLTFFARLRSFPQGRNVTQYQFADDFSIARGNHSLKFGVNFRRYDVSDHNFFYRHPRLLITDLSAFWQGTVGAAGGGYVRQDFGPNNLVAPIALYGLGVYAQDEWRVTPRLKLTLALRAERNANPTCRNNCFSLFADPFESKTKGSTVPYNESIRTGLAHPYQGVDYINFSPRFGFSWSPSSDDKTVISGGIGMFYDAMAQGLVELAFQNMPGYADFRVADGVWADPGGKRGGRAVTGLRCCPSERIC
jgi:outer membrane receptor protein involved in Fe transport